MNSDTNFYRSSHQNNHKLIFQLFTTPDQFEFPENAQLKFFWLRAERIVLTFYVRR